MKLANKIRIASLSVAAAIVVIMFGLYQHDSKVEAAQQAQQQAQQQAADAAASQAEALAKQAKIQDQQDRLGRMSPDQLKLENIWVDGVSTYAKAYNSTSNSVQQNAAYYGAVDATDKLLSNDPTAIGWYVQVYAINAFGDSVDVTFTSPQGVEYQDTDVKKGTDLYNQIANINQGQWVTISGRVVKSAEKDAKGEPAWNSEDGEDFQDPSFFIRLDDIDAAK
jgi:cellobiose-specific phosphotransferase system component IIB